MQNILFHTSLLIGDLMYFLPGIKKVCEENNRKAIIYLDLDQQWPMAPEIMRRGGITMTQSDLDNYRPLLIRQSYIEDVRKYEDEQVHVDLDLIMGKFAQNINIPYGCISRWPFLIWPEMTCDLSKPWIEVDEKIKLFSKKVIILSRSARSHNPHINYKFLEKYQDQIFFIGLDDEWKSFCRAFFEVHHMEIKNFLELAIALNSCKFFIGNQSFPYAVAEAMKIPRILELYADLPHVIPHGENAYDFYHQPAFQFYVEKMMKEL